MTWTQKSVHRNTILLCPEDHVNISADQGLSRSGPRKKKRIYFILICMNLIVTTHNLKNPTINIKSDIANKSVCKIFLWTILAEMACPKQIKESPS